MSSARVPPPAARILVVEDDPEIQYLLSRVLVEEDREVVLAATAADGERLLAHGTFDLLVLDLLLPDADGRTLLRSLRARSATATLPVVVMTSRVGLDLRTECFELGADAFVEKPFDPDVLAADVSSRLERAAVRTRLAQRDDLTGLLNLAGLLEALDKLAGRPRALVVAELDGIRAISNRYAWGTAEIIVAEVGKGLLAALPGALLARSAGSEFAAVLPGRGEAEATELAAAMLEAIRNVPVRSPDGETFRLTASAGLRADAGASDTHELVDAVRVLAHAAQSAGGNRVTSAAAPVLVASSAPLVLVAEDDDITAKILMHRLEKEAFEVLRFDNGNDAYRGALKRTPALVILDVKMPGMDGFEVLERLRKTPSYAAVPIMMLTGMGSEADVVRGFELGADDYLLKPFSPTELLARIRRLVRRGRSLG